METARLEIRLLGPLTIRRNGDEVPLPPSRKVRALLAFLALEPGDHTRSRLCDLLWDAPNDPRGELRWCLSRIRALVDDEDRRRVVTTGNERVALDLSDALVDVVECNFTRGGGQAPALQVFRGELLEGVELDGSPELTTWLASRRQHFRALHVDALRAHASRADDPLPLLEQWLRLEPFDRRAHEATIDALLKAERVRDAEDHVARMIRAFESEGLDWSELRAYWMNARRPSVRVAPPTVVEAPATRRASVAVMPFNDAPPSELAHGLTDDVITRLAKLRALFVIARGTVYALGERGIDAHEAGRILNVEYVVTGRVRRDGERVRVVVELAETRAARIVWTDELSCPLGAAFSVLDAIVNRIVATIAEEIESAEVQRAILKPPTSLDAWESYHRGLWHMYKFTAQDNRDAERFFQNALSLDPTLARAHAGLSFTHFQNVFLELTPDRDEQIKRAYDAALGSLAADERDPAAHWAMGRALWLRGAQEESVAELRRSVELSPNFALGHYTLGFVEAQSGDPRAAIEATNHSRDLSPFDPLQFAMLGSNAVAHIRLGELDEAVRCVEKAVGRPNAHAHFLAIAACTLSMKQRRDDACDIVSRIHERVPSYSVEHLLRAFRFGVDDEERFRRSARAIGFA